MTKFSELNFSPEATLNFVPTAAGAHGRQNILNFLLQNEQSLTDLLVTSNVKTFYKTKDFEFEERIVKMTFDEPILWLLPGVKPNGSLIQMPLVSVKELSEDATINSWRVYWDQGSLLRQIGLVPSDPARIQLNKTRPAHAELVPLLSGPQICARFFNETSEANPLLEFLSESHFSVDNLKKDRVGDLITGTAAEPEVRPSTRLNSKHVGGKSVVFSSNETPESKPKVNVDPRRYESHFTLGQDEQLTPNSLLAKTTKVEESKDMYIGKHIQRDPKRYESHFSLAHDGTPHLETLHLGRRFGQVRHNDSQVEMTSIENTSNAAEAEKIGKKLPVSVWESSSNGAGTVQSRPSSRVLRAPGGGSSIQLF